MSKPTQRLWTLAALGAVMIHATGVALAVVHMQTNEADDSLGAPAIEVGLEMMSPHIEATDLPPGPDAEAAAASPDIAEQKAEVKETDLPQAVPDEQPEPDRVVAREESKKPQEDDPKVEAVQASASTASVAQEAAAMPSTEAAQEGPRSVAPAQGMGESMQKVRMTWQKELVAYFDKHKRYPSERTAKNVEIMVSFVLDRVGHVLSSSIAKGSGDSVFDEAALAMVRRSDPVPMPPPVVADEGLSFTIPVNFRIKGKG